MALSGVDPIYSSQTKAVHETSGDLAPLLEIDHLYCQQSVLVDNGSYHHIVTGWITLTNKGKTNLEGIYIFINLSSDADIHQPYICDPLGNPAQPGLNFPNLAPNQVSMAQPYYWSLINLKPGAQEPGPFHVTPTLSPRYTVLYPVMPSYPQNDTTTVNLS